MNNRMKIALLAGTAALLAGATPPVLAVTCFEVFDRSETLIYRDTVSPVDLSTAGASAREALRARGETLVFFETDICIISGKAGATPGKTLTTDEIMAEWQSFGRGRSGTALSRSAGVPAGLPAAAAASPIAPAAGSAPGPAAAPATAPAVR